MAACMSERHSVIGYHSKFVLLDKKAHPGHISHVAETDFRRQLAGKPVHTQVWNNQEVSDLKGSFGSLFYFGAGFTDFPIQTL